VADRPRHVVEVEVVHAADVAVGRGDLRALQVAGRSEHLRCPFLPKCYARRVIEGWRPRRPAAFVAGPTRRGSRARPRPAPLPSGIDRRSPRTATPRAPGAREPPSTA